MVSYIQQILDHIPEIAIVIMDRRNRKILYINERGRALMDAGDPCLRPDCTVTDIVWPENVAALLITCFMKDTRRIFIRTFGHFDVFVDGKPVIFKSAKAKELLALLVDRRGGTVNSDQIITALWENRPNNEATQNLCSKVVKSLHDELERLGIEDILVVSRGIRYVDTSKFDCDLYKMLDGDLTARRRFFGEYLTDYSWAEERIGMLMPYHLTEDVVNIGSQSA